MQESEEDDKYANLSLEQIAQPFLPSESKDCSSLFEGQLSTKHVVDDYTLKRVCLLQALVLKAKLEFKSFFWKWRLTVNLLVDIVRNAYSTSDI